MSPDISPSSLQRKVQYDLRFYFFRRGMENLEGMKKDHFKLDFNQSTEKWRVVKAKDELTKNHKEIGELVTAVMPQMENDPLCPVLSYNKYQAHLNPENPFLWQVALPNVNVNQDAVWYGKAHIGKNPLSRFMTDVSKNCELSKIYTNHCIRVTGASILTRMQFSASEIMSVTGHKSVQSLAIYQKTDTKRKEEMGDVLGQAMQNCDENIRRKKLRALPPAENIHPPPPNTRWL